MGSYCTGLKEGKKPHNLFTEKENKFHAELNITDVYFLSVSFGKNFEL